MFSVVEDKNDPTPPILLIPEELKNKGKKKNQNGKESTKFEVLNFSEKKEKKKKRF